MASFRKHRTKDGKLVYLWRQRVPVKTPDGSVVYRLVERSTKSCSIAGAREAGRKFEAEYHAAADRPLQEISDYVFSDAALGYMKSGGERRYLAPILELIGKRPLVDITQELVQELTDRLKPGCAPATVNRHIFTPILSVLNYGARVKMCPPPSLVRPKGHDRAPKLEVPPEVWFNEVLPHLSEKVRACVLLITLHGLRIAEAIERTPQDLDTNGWRLTIPDTKAGEPVLVPLSAPVIEAIKAIPNWRKQRWLFGTCHRSNIARAIKGACKKAGVPSFGTHAIGRHSFSVRVLGKGKSVKFLMSAGRWKTATMPMKRYGHMERSEVNEAVNDLAAEWHQSSVPAKVIRLKNP
jgi:integrase